MPPRRSALRRFVTRLPLLALQQSAHFSYLCFSRPFQTKPRPTTPYSRGRVFSQSNTSSPPRGGVPTWSFSIGCPILPPTAPLYFRSDLGMQHPAQQRAQHVMLAQCCAHPFPTRAVTAQNRVLPAQHPAQHAAPPPSMQFTSHNPRRCAPNLRTSSPKSLLTPCHTATYRHGGTPAENLRTCYLSTTTLALCFSALRSTFPPPASIVYLTPDPFHKDHPHAQVRSCRLRRHGQWLARTHHAQRHRRSQGRRPFRHRQREDCRLPPAAWP